MLRPSAGETLRAWLLSALVVHGAVAGNPDAKRLYDDLLSNYNKLVRPVVNTSDVLRVCIKLKLSQLIDVLLMKPKMPPEFAEKLSGKTKNVLKTERDISSVSSIWSKHQISRDPDKNDVERGRLFPHAPCDQTCEDIYSSRAESILSKNLEKKLNKMSMVEEECCKSNLISDSPKEESKRRKNSHSPHGLKTKRKSHRGNHLEGFSRKIRNVDSTKEFRKILENFRIISEEEFDESGLEWRGSNNVVPAYFILKLAEDSPKKPSRSSFPTAQSFKLVFANDDEENHSEQKLEKRLSSTSPKMKDKFNQTDDVSENPPERNIPEDLEAKSKNKETSIEQSSCLVCLKMEREFAFQKEFNAVLLQQIKSMVGQLTIMTGLLGEILKEKSVCGENKGRVLQDLAKIRESSHKVFDFGMSDFSCCDRIYQDIESSGLEGLFNEISPSQSARIFKNDFERRERNKDVSGMIPLRKYIDLLYFSRAESNWIRKNQLLGKIGSSVLGANLVCPCLIKYHNFNGKESDLDERIKNKADAGKKRPLIRNISENAGLGPRVNEKLRKEELNEEEYEGDYGGGRDEMEDDGDETETEDDVKTPEEGEYSQGCDKIERFCEDQVRLVLDETSFYGSNGVELYSNEDTGIKLSSRASSRRALVKSGRSRNDGYKCGSAKKTKLGIAFQNFFTKKKASK